jgi:hypothetical protein
LIQEDNTLMEPQMSQEPIILETQLHRKRTPSQGFFLEISMLKEFAGLQESLQDLILMFWLEDTFGLKD